MKSTPFYLSFLFLAASCANPPQEETAAADNVDTTAAETVVAQEPSLELIWETDTVLTTNESVLIDKTDGTLYVSCISGMPTDKDGTGFISKINVDGQVVELEWAKGIDAPKGMGILEDKLYVTNVDELLQVDLKSGKVTKGFSVPGALFLNDIALGQNRLYFSDMKTGKLYHFDGERIGLNSEGHEELNGLDYYNGVLYGLDASGLVKFTANGAEIINADITGGDGLVVLNESTFIVSRWIGEIWLIKDGVATQLLNSKVDEIQTADIAFDKNTNMLYVPRFFSNKVSAYRLTY